MARAFRAKYEAEDIYQLYRQKSNEGDEQRLRLLAAELRTHTRLEHAVDIPQQYRAITKEVRTPYIRDAWSRISASLVAKSPVIQVQPKDEAREDYRAAAADASRWDMAAVERLNKQLGEDVVYNDTAALVRDGESVLKVVHQPNAWANFPRLTGNDAAETLRAQTDFKKGVDLPIAWRNVDRLSMLFGDGEYGDEWALEYGEYPLPYIKGRYGLARDQDGELFDPHSKISGRPKPEGYLQSNGGRCIKLEFFDADEWHVLIDGIEPTGWPKKNPYSPFKPYFRAKAHESESLLYSLLYLVPRLDELLTMKLNWVYLGSYPNPIISSTPSQDGMPGLDGPLGDVANPAGKKLTWLPGQLMELPPGQQLTFLAPPPIGADTNDLLTIFRGLIEIAGVPSVMRGSSTGGDSGYLANQMLAAAAMHYKLAGAALQRQHEQAMDFMHWMVPNLIKQTVWVQGWQEIDKKTNRPKTKAGRAWLALSPDEQSQNTAPVSKLGPVSFTFRPTLPTDEQARAMVAIQLTNPGNQLVSKRYALEEWVQVDDADAVLEEIVVEQAMNEEPLLSIWRDEALRLAGLLPPKDAEAPAAAPVDPLAALQGALGGGQGALPPGPNQLQPGIPGQAAGGLPSVPGLNMPIQPTPPQGGGLPAGQYPGQPGGPRG